MGSPRVLFEVTPPGRLASEEGKVKAFDATVSAIRALNRVDFVNVPEVIDENATGKPLYKNDDAGEYARALHAKTGAHSMVNKVVVHCHGRAGFEQWLDDATNRLGLHHFVFVGGNNAALPYPGPTVIEANQLASTRKNVSVGNILISSRDGEASRLLAKTKSGASFFTTQVLFTSDSTARVLGAYYAACDKAGVEASEVFLSFAPVATPHHLDFIRWLGAETPHSIENVIFNPKGKPADNSIALALEIWTHVRDSVRENYPESKLGINAAGLFTHNLDAAVRLANTLSKS
jgi:5,10-methylenetetrahydrofolate reductase